MGLIYHCEDCNKTLVFGIHTFYGHPLYDKKVLCQDCDIKYERLRDKMYLEAVDKAYTNVVDGFHKFMTNNSEEEEEAIEEIGLTDAKSMLLKLKELYKDGALSKQEYDKEMNRILRSVK